MIYLQLFWEFFKVGLFSFGGGLAQLPFLERISDATGWYSRRMLVDMIAISQSTPGPIGINTATYAGFAAAGVPGSIIATAGLVFPALIIATLAARFLSAYKENSYVRGAFRGIRPASLGMIAAAGFGVLRISLVNTAALSAGADFFEILEWKNLILFAVLYLLLNTKRGGAVHPVFAIAASAAVGVVFRL